MPNPRLDLDRLRVQLRRVLVATDLTPTSDPAFAHALRVALGVKGEVTVFHATEPGETTDWSALPTVRHMLEQWGVLSQGASVAEFEALGVRVSPHARATDAAAMAVAAEVLRDRADLLVMAAHGRRSVVDRLIQRSVSEPAARWAAVPTLFLPIGGRGIVDPVDGSVRMHRVLFPVHEGTPASVAVEYGVLLGKALGAEVAEGVLAHVGPRDSVPEIDLRPWASWAWRTEVVTGPVPDGIARIANEVDADLVVMATHGHDSLADMLFGSRTERVLGRIQIPLLAIPVP